MVQATPAIYLFPGLAAGTYFARFYPPSAYPNASPYDQGADTLDSDGQPVSGQIYLHSHFTTLTTGQAYVDTDQGFYGTDWGDLPEPLYNTDSAGTAGPSHVIIPGLYLGGFIDAESDGRTQQHGHRRRQ